MTVEEIIEEYRKAEDKDSCIEQMAQDTDSDIDTIVQILKMERVYEPKNIFKCRRCGARFVDTGMGVCEKCRYMIQINGRRYDERLNKLSDKAETDLSGEQG